MNGMSLNEITVPAHPLQQILKDRGIKLWQLKKALGGKPSESYLSKVLSGVQEMPQQLERRISELLGVELD